MQGLSGMEIFPGYAGMACAMIFSNIGSALGMNKTGSVIGGIAAQHPTKIAKSLVPVVMSSILGIYGLIVSIFIVRDIHPDTYTWYKGYKALSSGLIQGFSSLFAGYAIGQIGEHGIRKFVKQERIFIGMMLILVFAEAVALLGLICSMIVLMSQFIN